MRNYNVTVLERAILEKKRVRIMYLSDGVITERLIKPFCIEGQSVKAYCYLRRSKRTFKMEGILSAQMTEK